MTEVILKPAPNREPIKILIIGSPKRVNTIIDILYRLRFVEVCEWSPLQSTANPGAVVSILKRQRSSASWEVHICPKCLPLWT